MKIHPVQNSSWRKMYVSYPAGLTAPTGTNNVRLHQSENHATGLINEEAPKIEEFQRKAFVGNYFAGPHCLFDPRLFK